MASVITNIILVTVLIYANGYDIEELQFGSDEVMIAQESGRYQTIVKPPFKMIKPTGDTNSHRPQFVHDSLEKVDLEDFPETSTKRTLVKNYKSSSQIRTKEGIVKEAVLKALENKDHIGKLVQMIPIIQSMTDSQKRALASFVASQVAATPAYNHMSLSEMRSMFGNEANTTSDLMLPILLDMANLINSSRTKNAPQAQILRRSDDDHTYFEDEVDDSPFEFNSKDVSKHRTRRIPQKTENSTSTNKTEPKNIEKSIHNARTRAIYSSVKREGDTVINQNHSSTTQKTTASADKTRPTSTSKVDNSTLTTLDLIADSTNNTLAQDLPVAEKLRALTRYSTDRKGLIRRGIYPPKPIPTVVTRRTTVDPSLNSLRRRPYPAKKLPLPSEVAKCELFTNTLCLNAEDYPTEAIIQSIRRNKATAGALLADFKDPGEGAIDGLTAEQEAQYTTDTNLVSNRRGDTANRDFASAGEAGFMCPSTVKYARPQRARATSGQWKYIVNTGEHTQTLRLEKCLKAKESCAFLTDNFKSKCVQVYNYHRLLTWDQQNGLHMDIFKVPTCCSCHIEGYSVSFPPLGHRIHETSSETFPGEDLSAEHGNHAFESVQSTMPRPIANKSPFIHTKPSESFPPFSDSPNFIPGQPFSKITNEDILHPLNPIDSYGNYFPDSFNQASSIKNVKRPPSRNFVNPNIDSLTLPSYLEPPTPSATSTFIKDSSLKFKNINTLKRGANRNRRPIRKKISDGPDDLTSSGTFTMESFTSSMLDSTEDQHEYMEEPEIGQASVPSSTKKRITIAPKLHAVTTEKLTTLKSEESAETFNSGKKINYNYHPIIDFFAEGEKNESIDREDSETSYIAMMNTEWKPVNHPPSRNIQSLVRKQKK